MSSHTGFVYHEKFLEHDTGAGHPENAERLKAIVNRLKECGLWKQLQHLIIDEAEQNWLLRVHTNEHLKYLKQACKQNLRTVDQGDTQVSAESYNAAILAAGGAITATDAVMSGLLKNAFCAVRPPGHHAERDKAMGFCLLNNAAICARYAQVKSGAERIAILDWDVHHGNGTQHIFYDDKSVLYISTHQFPFYPGTGSRGERGVGNGEGYTLNIPMFAGSGEIEFLEVFKEQIIPSLNNFCPDLLIISAGFDAHKDDPLGNLQLTEDSFGIFTELLMDTCENLCGGRIVSVLEGGYNMKALSASVEAHIRTLIS